MKNALTAAAIALAMTAATSPAGANSGFTVWRGDMFVTKLSSQCTGKNVGNVFQAVFQPANQSGNGATDKLILFSSQPSAQIFVPASGTYLNKAAGVTGQGIDVGGAYGGVGKILATTASVNPPTPVGGTNPTPSVKITITITDPSTNCATTGSGTLVWWPY